MEIKKEKIGIIATGKAFSDTIDTLKNLGISESCKDLGINLLKIVCLGHWTQKIEKVFLPDLMAPYNRRKELFRKSC